MHPCTRLQRYKNWTSANYADDKNHITQTVHKLKQNVGREVYFVLFKCNGFDHPECGWCEWISKCFGSHLDPFLQTLSNGWPETDVNTRCKQGMEHTVGIHSKTEELSSKSASGLRELSDWRLCVWDQRSLAGVPAWEAPEPQCLIWCREVCVFLFQFPASITEPTSQSWLDNKPLSHAHMHKLPRRFMIKRPANRVHAKIKT